MTSVRLPGHDTRSVNEIKTEIMLQLEKKTFVYESMELFVSV